ncbi:TonB-dependent receptor [Alteromonas macleodii]|uniref:TonB dependent receptor family protein n=2 Tax=Alteromonas TaxID=226 RepID=A0AB36FUB9_ALTMA|nr:TonB-dependent receptor [Alteromonas macleodii]OES33625.1 tonB dependent receptor family protein [Alteromonas macleodii]OES35065.1 tonB dependent receptor family protein [Alteromonas macleodii]OES37465.1 tonB dependent receptor family protein [Alteromonas macleodii]OES42531.1 tonB dependent receptor family protein [Alteromonas macleodii]
MSLSALHIASGFFLFIAPAPTLHAQTDSPSQSPDQTEPKLGAYSFSIPAQNANEALTELAKQANTTLLFPFDLAKKVKTNALEGTFTLNEALAQLLEGTELAVVTDESGAVSIRSRSSLVAKETQTQDTEKKTDEGGNGLEKIAVVGTRNSPRSAVDSPVPLDVIGSETLNSQGNSDVLSMLSVMVPSLNVNDQPINDASSLVRPANLRGMSSDHTLLLLNGKRRHRSAVITFLGGGLSDGAQGPDISVIPAYALKQVEVLRDGAAAQYGSDAIAGVINFVLKDAREGGHVALKVGGYSEGDGELFQVQLNKGFAIGENGFLNATAEYRQQNGTSRSVQRIDAQNLIDQGNVFIASPSQVWGALDVNEDIKLALNAGADISSKSQFYSFATAARREINGGFYFRNPQTREGVFSRTDPNTGESRLIVADLDGLESGIACPSITLSSNSVLLDPSYQLIADNTKALGANCFAFNEWFPGGFTPKFGGTITDASVAMGVKHELPNGWAMDASATLGYSDIEYTISNTVNPSLGPQTPTSFSPGGVSQVERTLNLDFNKLIQTIFDDPVSIAVGLEWRKETYFQKSGDEASYIAGPFALEPPLGLNQGFSIGSNGFPGYQPQSAGHWSRSNWAVYADLEFYVTEAWQFGVATRVEHFSDFGSTFDGKLSTRYKLNDIFALRGSVNTGFKAPTVGQSNVINVTTAYGVNGLEDQATLPPTDLISLQLGATPLTPEESVNFSLGLVMQASENFFATLDYFNIRLSDRISTTSAIPLTDDDISALIAQGRPDAAKYNAAKYFTNDFDTKTQGVDLVVNYNFALADWSNSLLLAFNWTDTQVERVTLYPAQVGDEIRLLPNLTQARIRMLEDNLPAHRGSITLEQSKGNWAFTWRLNYYGEFYEDHLDASAGMDIYGNALTTFDAQVAWKVLPQTQVTLGAQNLFDSLPNENPFQGEVGALYPPTSPSGINGAFYYAGIEYTFN